MSSVLMSRIFWAIFAILAGSGIAACGPPCARAGTKCAAEAVEEVPEEEPLYSMVLTTHSIYCTPYEGWEELETPGGEVVSGLEVCAEFEDACLCETNETTRHGKASVSPDPGSGEGCFAWELVESGFWAYPRGTVCPGIGGWSLDIEAWPGAVCAITLPPQVEWTALVRMEVACEWTTDDGTVLVTDRLLIQILS